jgi:hypothetical protein
MGQAPKTTTLCKLCKLDLLLATPDLAICGASCQKPTIGTISLLSPEALEELCGKTSNYIQLDRFTGQTPEVDPYHSFHVPAVEKCFGNTTYASKVKALHIEIYLDSSK